MQVKLSSKLSPEALDVAYANAYQLYQHGKYEKAKHFFHFLTIANTYERKYWMGLAASYQMLKNYPKALECYSIAALQDANDPYVHLHAADCFTALGQQTESQKALGSAEKAAEQDEKYKELLSQLKWIRNQSK